MRGPGVARSASVVAQRLLAAVVNRGDATEAGLVKLALPLEAANA